MAPAGGIWAPIAVRAIKHAFKATSKLFERHVANIIHPAQLQATFVRTRIHQPLYPAALLHQRKGRWHISHSAINATLRRLMSTSGGYSVISSRSTYSKSSTAIAVSKITTKTTFASTLRPNITGGAFPRTAGGYSIGGGRIGGARYFSHMPEAPAQVINTISASMRAFLLSGQKAQFNGIDATGQKRYRSVSILQEQVARKIQRTSKFTPGSYIDFHFNPTITALTPLSRSFPFRDAMEHSSLNLNAEGFLDVLSLDLSRALKDLDVTLNDLRLLSNLGDLPITLEDKSILRIHFPGCDYDSVERLCTEFGIRRGIVYQEKEFDSCMDVEMAFVFPYAPGSGHTLSHSGNSLQPKLENPYGETMDKHMLDEFEIMDNISEGESAYFTNPSELQASSYCESVEGIR